MESKDKCTVTTNGMLSDTSHDNGQNVAPATTLIQKVMEHVKLSIPDLSEAFDMLTFEALSDGWREQFDEVQLRKIDRRVSFLVENYYRTSDKSAMEDNWQKIINAALAYKPSIEDVWLAVVYKRALEKIKTQGREVGNSTTNAPGSAQHAQGGETDNSSRKHQNTPQDAMDGQINHTISDEDKKRFSEMFKPTFRGMNGSFNQFETLCADIGGITSNKDFAAVCAMIHDSKMKNDNMPKKFTDFYSRMCGFFNFEHHESYKRKGNLSDNMMRLKNGKFTYL